MRRVPRLPEPGCSCPLPATQIVGDKPSSSFFSEGGSVGYLLYKEMESLGW